MPDFIITLGGQPHHVKAVPYNGMLWDEASHLPIIDPAKLAALGPQERAHVTHILAHPPQSSIRELLRDAIREGCEVNKSGDSMMRWHLRGRWREKFFPNSKVSHDRAIQKCALKTPSNLPLTCKLAEVMYEFHPYEVAILSKNPKRLIEEGRHQLFFMLRRAKLIDPTKWKQPADHDRKDPEIDAMGLTQRWYQFPSMKTLETMVDMFGYGDPYRFFHFIDKYCTWRQCSHSKALTLLSQIAAPATENYDANNWRMLFEKQMKLPFHGDWLPELFPHMDKIEEALKRQNRVLLTTDPASLRGHTVSKEYKNAEKHPCLARLCYELGFPEESFERGLRFMRGLSSEDVIPAASIKGETFGLPGYLLEKLAKDDPVSLVAGAYVECCGHIDGARKRNKMELIGAMVTRPDVGCYVIRNPQNLIVAKFTVWLTPADAEGTYGFVINAWHDADPALKAKRTEVVSAIAEEVQRIDSNITRVLLGRKNYDLPFPVTPSSHITPRDPSLATSATRECFILTDRRRHARDKLAVA